MEFYVDLGVKSITTSVEHLQTNGQVESANNVILGHLEMQRNYGPRSYQRYYGHIDACCKQQLEKLHSTSHMVLMP